MDAAAAAASGSGSVERRLIDWPARRRVSAHRWARRAAPHARPAAAATEWYDELVAFSQRSLIHTVLCLRGLCSLVPIIRFPCAFTLILYFHSAQRSTLPHSLPSQNVLSPSLTEFALRRRFAVRSAVTQIGSTVQYSRVCDSIASRKMMIFSIFLLKTIWSYNPLHVVLVVKFMRSIKNKLYFVFGWNSSTLSSSNFILSKIHKSRFRIKSTPNRLQSFVS